MRILIAPDSFKECLSALEVANYIQEGFSKVLPDSEFKIIPFADGGEGTVKSIITATGGEYYNCVVHDPLFRKITATYGIMDNGKTAIIEMAEASGLSLLKSEERNPLVTSTYGTGELILDALNKGVTKIILGIGGSATNDGGTGMASALGVKFHDENDAEFNPNGGNLHGLKFVDTSNIDKRIYQTEIIVACDVTNPLTGTSGASYVYGPQKGASPETVQILDDNLKHYAKILREKLDKEIEHYPGSGAAGGLGAGTLAFLNATLESGFEIISSLTRLEDHIKESDLVITGEGRIDSQTLNGKVIKGISDLCNKYTIPLIALGGSVELDNELLYKNGITAAFSITNSVMTLDTALKHANKNIVNTSSNIARLLTVFKKLN
ncbi:MAG: glycerate kinase [Bacillales bacterium]|jgi:glycerate kinase|nr:glycerate kinase [Bacillales bacterium]